MRKFMRMIAVVAVVVLSMTMPLNMIVKAEEPEETTGESEGVDYDIDYRDEYISHGCGTVLSEDIVEGHWLQWESKHFFDTLIAVSDENLHITYEYNEAGLRVKK